MPHAGPSLTRTVLVAVLGASLASVGAVGAGPAAAQPSSVIARAVDSCVVTDGVSPTVSGVDVSPAVVDARAEKVRARFRVEVSDTDTGVSYVTMSLVPTEARPPVDYTETLEMELSSGSVTSGVWTASHVFHPWTWNGVWLLSVSAFDDAGNSVVLKSADLGAEGWPGELRVRSTPDTKAPRLRDLRLSQRIVDTRQESQLVVISAVVKDHGGSGVAAVTAYVGSDVLLDRVPGSDTYRGRLRVPRYASQERLDRWPISVSVQDRARNDRRYSAQDLAELGLPSRLVVKTRPDRQPPVISSLTLERTSMDVTLSDGTARALADVVDARSGTASVDVAMGVEPGADAWAPLHLVKDATPQDGPWAGRLWVPECSPSGTYTILEIVLVDRAGNELILDSEEAIAAGLEAELVVTGW